MIIRHIEPNDYRALCELWQAAQLTFDIGDAEEDFAWALQHYGQHYFVMEEESRIIGSVLAAFDGRRGWIYHLAVHPEFQRRGLGRRLMEHAEASLSHMGCLKINLLIEPHNLGVKQFYTRLGYSSANNQFMEKIIHSQQI
ncbi:MAG: GNAT family acetyltransferase [Sulfobacillus thermosulfidooxidans]|uniref:GNAT family acetyltransferase n=1 Tax=Sulfobacillus thermosulfidooxidans TaxID=28034 RepID=A0A2T2WDL1_SULTH|nr:MAG: GNAT family acetyltransferase [Sulfobacillus thermosulfidooxidans]